MQLISLVSNEPFKKGMERVHEKIKNNIELQTVAKQLLHILYDLNSRDEFLKFADEKKDLFADKLGKDADCYLACVFDIGFDRVLDIYKKRSIPSEILKSTMSDFDVQANNFYVANNYAGISNYQWLLWHMSGRLFKVGRLQFIMDKGFNNDSYVFKNIHNDELIIAAKGDIGVDCDGFKDDESNVFVTEFAETEYAYKANIIDKRGRILSQKAVFSKADYKCALAPHDDVLDVHISAQGKMSIEDCHKSMNDVIEFGKKHFPEYNYKAFSLNSWLLSDEVKEILDENSNISKFANLFVRTAGYRSAHPIIYNWIFGFDKNIQDYKFHEAKTSLQQGAHKLINEGRWFVERTGIKLI